MRDFVGAEHFRVFGFFSGQRTAELMNLLNEDSIPHQCYVFKNMQPLKTGCVKTDNLVNLIFLTPP